MARKVRIVSQQQVPQTRNINTSFAAQHSIQAQETKTSSWELSNRHHQRPPEILQAVKNLDMTSDPVYRQQLLDWLRQTYSERCGGLLVAIFAKCYLGEPYQDHYVSLTGNIVEHYKRNEPVPDMFLPARPLAASPAYAYIEIYSDGEIIPVAEDGTVR